MYTKLYQISRNDDDSLHVYQLFELCLAIDKRKAQTPTAISLRVLFPAVFVVDNLAALLRTTISQIRRKCARDKLRQLSSILRRD